MKEIKKTKLLFIITMLFFSVILIPSLVSASITYDSGTNTITVTGYNESTPCTFNDIYNADVAGGWGVVTMQGDNQFCFSCKLVIGDGSTTTWFVDKAKQIYFVDGLGGGSPVTVIDIKDYAHVRWGECLDATKKLGANGISVLFTEPTDLYRIDAHYTSWSGSVEYYGCQFVSNGRRHFLTAPPGTKAYHCTVNRFSFGGMGASYVDIYALTIANSDSYALSRCTGDLDLITAFKNEYALSSAYDIQSTIKNVVAKSNTYLFRAYKTSVDNYLVNVDADAWTFNWYSTTGGAVYRQYEFDLKVIDKNNTPISGATVKIWDKDGNLVTNETTDANGEIPTQTLNYGYYTQANGDTPTMQTPHTILINKTGYHNYTANFSIDKKTDWTIALQATCPSGGGSSTNCSYVDITPNISSYTLNENGLFDTYVEDQNGTLINVDSITGNITQPDSTVDVLNFSNVGTGHYQANYTFSHVGDYVLKTTATKTGYSSHMVEEYVSVPFVSLKTISASHSTYTPGETINVGVGLEDADGVPVTGATCLFNISYPNSTLWKDSINSSYSTAQKVYYNNSFTAPEVYGSYYYTAKCTYGTNTAYNYNSFYVAPACLSQEQNSTISTIYNQTGLIYTINKNSYMNPSFVLWIILLLGSASLLFYGSHTKKIIVLFGSTILFMVVALYSFSFTTIIGETGTWIMIGVSIIGFSVGLIYLLSGLVNILKNNNEEPKENLGL